MFKSIRQRNEKNPKSQITQILVLINSFVSVFSTRTWLLFRPAPFDSFVSDSLDVLPIKHPRLVVCWTSSCQATGWYLENSMDISQSSHLMTPTCPCPCPCPYKTTSLLDLFVAIQELLDSVRLSA